MGETHSIQLRGMTWDHPRGYGPLRACSATWFERTGVRIEWERRSLQDFEAFPVAELAARYDLIVIDHPHVGQVARTGCLAPFETREAGSDAVDQAVGASLQSYRYQEQLWALPIDAAAQVQAWRPDRLAAPPADWAAVLELALDGGILCPLRPPHNLMALFTLCGLAGHPACAQGDALFDPAAGAEAYERLRELAARLDPRSAEWDPIAVLEQMAVPDATAVCAPLVYGYVSYARPDAPGTRLAFSDVAPLQRGGSRAGSALGGTGIAVSAHGHKRDAALAFARWLAGAEAQCGPYVAGGGQPAHRAAWEDPRTNEATLGFYRNTRATLEGAWVRPRHAGYMIFQERASLRLGAALGAREPPVQLIAALNRLYLEVLP
jgi:multiple sugar transport system substrate-binding protein